MRICVASLFLTFSFVSQSQLLIKQDVFKTEMKDMFLQANKGFPSEEIACSTADGVMIKRDGEAPVLQLKYNCFSSDEAVKTKEMLASMVTEILPPGDYSANKGYGAAYFDYLKWLFEFDSTDFAEKKKRPSIEIGALQNGDQYTVMIYVRSPHFIGQYTPRWD